MHPSARRHPWPAWSLLMATLIALAGCGSAPRLPAGGAAATPRPAPAPAAERDGPQANPPADLARVPDAEPRIEAPRKGGPNKPYEALGRAYVPITDDRPFSERGLASWYGRKFHGRPTASGEPYDMYAMTAAHPTLPIPSYVRVRNPANEREVIVRVNDRGPFHSGRIIDLSYTAALKLGLLKGVAPVEIWRITPDEIRAGTWRKGAPSDAPERAPTALASAARARLGDVDGPPAVAPPIATKAGSRAAADPPAVVAEATGVRASPATAAPGEAEDTPGASPAAAPEQAAAATAGAASAAAPAVGGGASARPSPGFWVQLGVFKQREGADGFQRRVSSDLGWLAPLLAVFSEPSVYRLQAGPYASRDEAQGVARRVRESLSLVPVVVERR